MVLMRGLMAVVAVAAIVAAGIGCSSGLSTSDATLRCMQAEADTTDCFDANVYNLCLSCYERCGDNCTPQATCPSQFLCPGDTLIDAGSDAL